MGVIQGSACVESVLRKVIRRGDDARAINGSCRMRVQTRALMARLITDKIWVGLKR